MKKLQIFISSTFLDLQEERQAAVEAVLSAGHIPAGMELFKAGNDSQLVTINRWIDESDVYMLILGGRYGSIEPNSGKSYTHLEYEYAVSRNIPVFAVVLSEEAVQEKVKILGTKAIETDHGAKYKEFKDFVLNRISKFADDLKDIKLALLETISDFQKRYDFTGWVSGKDIPNNEELYKELARLTAENEKLKKGVRQLKNKQETSINGLSYDQISSTLSNKTITLPVNIFQNKKSKEINLLTAFKMFGRIFANGVTNASNIDEAERFLYYHMAPEFIIFGLIEEKKLTGKHFLKRQNSKDGNRFLALLQADAVLEK
ncbi:DUF4062 domain-containing protein [Exiguobacterium aurantiacum]|uniref:DUF4062 domain-containing protein n=1 Tax=Exiguobacterium aurantiacum TaxID=33987 RepID=UPI001E438009|nr:DUF4062 domain-containing protein [Exiguobacterium aurantiacum]